MNHQGTGLRLWNEALRRVARREVWVAGGLMIASGALGGIGLALWNRRALRSIRDADSREAEDENARGGSPGQPETEG